MTLPLPQPQVMHNGLHSEYWPAWLLRARRSADARALARATRCLRAKDDGRYLAAITADGRSLPLGPCVRPAMPMTLPPRTPPAMLPLHGLATRLRELGLEAQAYAQRTGLAPVAEPGMLHLAGFDRYRRPLWLHAAAARAWRAMQAAAQADGIVLEAISGYRSHAYQLGIFRRKRARGLDIDAILAVNAAPGFSEHHGGMAIDIGTPGEPPAETSFERTAAFDWLRRHAHTHGFILSYPRGNVHGITYEPWHWCFAARSGL